MRCVFLLVGEKAIWQGDFDNDVINSQAAGR
jgi:hypothetical protein